MSNHESPPTDNLTRPTLDTLDAILGQRFAVLDDGFVRLIDYMGDDHAVVQAARVSYGKGTKQVHEDRGLIRYLLRHHHTTPLEMCELKLHVRVPMDCWRQWIRHRTANVNEYSTRYSEAINATQKTLPEGWRSQATTNRQGSGEAIDVDTGRRLSRQEREIQDAARAVYNDRLEQGVAREQARKDLPLSTYTEAYWKVDLHNLLHFLELRMHPSAQREIQDYAQVIGHEIVRRWVPLVWEAFVDYRLEALALTRIDVDVIRALASGGPESAIAAAERNGILPRDDAGRPKRNRERAELEEKMERLGMAPPWR